MITKTKEAENTTAMHCMTCSGYDDKIDIRQETEQELEIASMQKHDIICSLSEELGDCPENLALAEKIFDKLRYQIAEHVIKYEFNCENKLPVSLAMWLEQKRAPEKVKPLESLIASYLKPAK